LNTDLKEKIIAAHISVQYEPNINILKRDLAFGVLNFSKYLENFDKYFDRHVLILIFIENLSSEKKKNIIFINYFYLYFW